MDRTLLPLFPLELVLYPEERVPLHIFEVRYQEMIRDCLEGDRLFGVVLQQDGRLASVGCTARIVRIARRYDDGRLDIVVAGGQRFRIDRVVEDRAYLQGRVARLPEHSPEPDPRMRERLITQHLKLLELGGRMPSPVIYQDRPLVSYVVANNAGLSLEQKQLILELPDESRRIDFLVAHLEAFIPKVEEVEALRRKVRSNGHFPDFPMGSDEPDQEEPDA